jgi:hypothetical protein
MQDAREQIQKISEYSAWKPWLIKKSLRYGQKAISQRRDLDLRTKELKQSEKVRRSCTNDRN